MPRRVRDLALRTVTSYPVYRLLPSGPLRMYAALRYHDAKPSRADVAGLRRTPRRSVRYLSTGMVAAQAAFRTGQDDLVEELLTGLEERFPRATAPLELRADLLSHRGEFDVALQAAERARELDPHRATAVAKVVRYGYEVLGEEKADEASLVALRLFPLNQTVMWAVGKNCFSRDQAERVVETWRDVVGDQASLPTVVRQLATAAARGRRADLACDLYREAIIAVHQNPSAATPVAPRKLEGKGAWVAIEQVADALDRAGVPFFFAAGTALGLVREGRPLALDGDIDVGVFERDWDSDGLRELFRRDPRFILDPNPMTSKVGLKHRGGSPIDIFQYYKDDGKFWHDGVFVRWDNTPFSVERHQINGLSLPLPSDADTYLTENYGDWRVPNPGYDVFTEAPNFHLHWPEYGRMHLMREAFKAMASGDRATCQARLSEAMEQDLVRALHPDNRSAA